ncbi:hypothetical protein PFISCL1PPCAC_16699, partial [Pristionchus fissidentatus]
MSLYDFGAGMQHANFSRQLADLIQQQILKNGCSQKRSIECESDSFHISLMGFGFIPILFLAI